MLPVLLMTLACGRERTIPCEVTPDADVAQAPHVRWTTPKSGSSWVSYTSEVEQGSTTPVDDGTDHDVPLVGLPPLTQVAFTAYTATEGPTFRCDGQLRTGNLPVGAPDFTVTVNDPTRTSPEAFLFGSAISVTQYAQFALERDGRVRWLLLDDPAHYGVMSKPALGGGVVRNRFTREPWFREGELVWGPMVGEPTRHEQATTVGSHHVFLELPDGNVVFIREDLRSGQLSDGPHSIVGDELMELAPDGTLRSIFSTWDHLELRDAITTFAQTWPEGLDWTHGNALDYDAERDTLLFSMANVRTVVEIDRASGELVRSFHGGDDWTLDGQGYGVASGEPFHHQHDAKWSAAGTLLMSATEEGTLASVALEYAVDDEAHTLTEIWRYKPEPAATNWALGQVQELANGNRLVATNYAGLVQEVTPDGTVVWEAHTPLNVVFGQVYLVDDLPR